jgi:hypothetical protein
MGKVAGAVGFQAGPVASWMESVGPFPAAGSASPFQAVARGPIPSGRVFPDLFPCG